MNELSDEMTMAGPIRRKTAAFVSRKRAAG
jgi:hypothetical protein